MPKFHVLLDTNVYRKNPPRTDLSFKALERLCLAGVCKLHLPYVIEREFQTQQTSQYKKEIDGIASGLERILRKGYPEEVSKRAKELNKALSEAAPAVIGDAAAALTNWAISIGAARHPISADQAIAAMEAYFEGTPPLKAPKNRDDIPDAFIFQCIRTLAEAVSPLSFVAEDEKLASAAQELPNVSVFRSLDAFIASPFIQAALADMDVNRHLAALVESFRVHEAQTAQFSHFLERAARDALLSQVIYSETLPSEKHDARIVGVAEPETIDLEFSEIQYYGNGEFGLPFLIGTYVELRYFVFKGDHDLINSFKPPRVSDRDEYYYEANEDEFIFASGIMKIGLDSETLRSSTVNAVEEFSIAIDSISLDSVGIPEAIEDIRRLPPDAPLTE